MKHSEFLRWLEQRGAARKAVELNDVVASAGGPERCAVVVVDMLEGFCRSGALASPRVNALVGPVGDFLTRCHGAGVETFLFSCDAHQKDSQEFQAFPLHCVAGAVESEIVEDLRALPFAHLFERIDKRSVSSLLETSLASRLQGDRYRKILCVGDCTDLCVYSLATGLRHLANSQGLMWDVLVPANLVATYDLPLATAQEVGVLPHPGDLLHDLFLYHMELNGVSVVASID